MHFNTYNENYIMINKFAILMKLAHFDSINNRSKDENELFYSKHLLIYKIA